MKRVRMSECSIVRWNGGNMYEIFNIFGVNSFTIVNNTLYLNGEIVPVGHYVVQAPDGCKFSIDEVTFQKIFIK